MNAIYNDEKQIRPTKHQKHSIRLPGYDYSQPDAYYVTIVARHRECLLGEVVNEEMSLSEFGMLLLKNGNGVETQYDYVELGAWVVMPNHFHGILVFHENRRGGSRSTPTPTKPKP